MKYFAFVAVLYSLSLPAQLITIPKDPLGAPPDPNSIEGLRKKIDSLEIHLDAEKNDNQNLKEENSRLKFAVKDFLERKSLSKYTEEEKKQLRVLASPEIEVLVADRKNPKKDPSIKMEYVNNELSVFCDRISETELSCSDGPYVKEQRFFDSIRSFFSKDEAIQNKDYPESGNVQSQ